jgi:hypothetical protein
MKFNPAFAPNEKLGTTCADAKPIDNRQILNVSKIVFFIFVGLCLGDKIIKIPHKRQKVIENGLC